MCGQFNEMKSWQKIFTYWINKVTFEDGQVILEQGMEDFIGSKILFTPAPSWEEEWKEEKKKENYFYNN